MPKYPFLSLKLVVNLPVGDNCPGIHGAKSGELLGPHPRKLGLRLHRAVLIAPPNEAMSIECVPTGPYRQEPNR